MSASQDSPFKPGARCALRSFSDNYSEVFVDRVHKNGNFTLRDRGSQQWRPYSSGSGWQQERTVTWHAYKTGDRGYDRESLTLWDATIDAEINQAMEQQRLRNRLAKIQKRVERLRFVNDSYLTALELALPPLSKEASK